MRATAYAAAFLAAGLAVSASAEIGEPAPDGVAVAGCWIGQVEEKGIGRYTLVLDVTESAGRVEYRTSFGLCAAALRRRPSAPSGAALFLEKLVEGVDLCVDDLEIRLRPQGPERLDFEELESGRAVVSGPLYRSERDAEGRCEPKPDLLS